MKNFIISLFVIVGLLLGNTPTVNAETLAPMDKLSIMEKVLYGTDQSGALLDRMDRLEMDMSGATENGAILNRVDRMYGIIKGGENVYEPTFLLRLGAAEYTFGQAITDNPAKTRLEKLETFVIGKTNNTPLLNRLDSVMNVAYTNGKVPTEKATLLKDTLIKVQLAEALNGKTAQVGQKIKFSVTDNIAMGNVVLISKGSIGHGIISKVVRAQNFGRDGKIEINFESIVSLDGTLIPVFLGPQAEKEMKNMAMAAGVSVAGMIVLGPVGIIGGIFVHGQDAIIPVGTPVIVQVKEEHNLVGMLLEGSAKVDDFVIDTSDIFNVPVVTTESEL